MKPRPFWPVLVGFLAGSGVTIPVVSYMEGGSRLIDVALSPDGRYRVEQYSPKRWQVWVEPPADMPGFARLSRTNEGQSLGDSEVFEQSGNGTIDWFPGGVQVGSSASFEYREGRWHTEPSH